MNSDACQAIVVDASPQVDRRSEVDVLQAALDSVPLGLAVFDHDLQILAQNKQFFELLGGAPSTNLHQNNLLDVLTSTGTSASSLSKQIPAFCSQGINRGPQSSSTIHFKTTHGRQLSAKITPACEGYWTLQLEKASRAVPPSNASASVDPLTGLPNRGVLQERLVQACQDVTMSKGSVAVLLVDLDRFKSVNDTLGHPIGDALLRTVAERMRSAVRTDDLVSRIGGDEFAIILMDQPEEDAASTAARIVELMKRPFLLRGHLVNIGCSVGIALAPQDTTDADTLLIQADLALYQAKANGRGTFSFFRPELQERAQARRTLEQELRKALMLRQYELYYQPQIDVGTGGLIGFEALLRWRHPTRGLVNPAAFVPLLEELRLIMPVGEWVLRTACAEAVRWPGDLSVAVNVAASQFESDRFVPIVAAALAASGLPSHRLEIEVTETALLHHGDATRAALHALREMGVHIAMDEFGTGYSSMSQLRAFRSIGSRSIAALWTVRPSIRVMPPSFAPSRG
jgi:diguanylate cyclase (GGDEF)-like protein